MEQQNYTYDVALSFANEDLAIAKKIASELKRLNLHPYLYTEETTLASNLTKNTWEIYSQESQFSLVIISKYYKEKKWASREWDAIQTVHRQEGVPYIIPLRLDETELPGLNPDIIFLKWEANASYIAISLFQLIHSIKKNKKKINPKKTQKQQKPETKTKKTTNINFRDNKIGGVVLGDNNTINNTKK